MCDRVSLCVTRGGGHAADAGGARVRLGLGLALALALALGLGLLGDATDAVGQYGTLPSGGGHHVCAEGAAPSPVCRSPGAAQSLRLHPVPSVREFKQCYAIRTRSRPHKARCVARSPASVLRRPRRSTYEDRVMLGGADGSAWSIQARWRACAERTPRSSMAWPRVGWMTLGGYIFFGAYEHSPYPNPRPNPNSAPAQPLCSQPWLAGLALT